MGKEIWKTALVVGLVCASCAGSRPATLADFPGERPWKMLIENCEPTPDKKITCDPDAFYQAGKGCIAIAMMLDQTRADLDTAQKLSAVNAGEYTQKLITLETALNSPWRSPWLWGAIGLVLGVATGAAIGVGSK